MVYKVYAIVSNVDKRIYVGLSNNIDSRVKSHNNGQVRSTKPFRPWKLIYQEIVGTRSQARKREKFLKSGCGKEFLKSIRENIPG